MHRLCKHLKFSLTVRIPKFFGFFFSLNNYQNALNHLMELLLLVLFFFFLDSNFVLGNALSNSFPIVYCSDGFCELTGHSRAHVMGKSCACKFLYGENTENEGKAKIEEALEQKEEIKTEILLYRKDGRYDVTIR